MKNIATAVAAGLFGLCATAGIASAQQYGYPQQYGNPNPYGYQQPNRRDGAVIRGTITGVNGNQVTIRLGENGNGYGGDRYGRNGYGRNGYDRNGYGQDGYGRDRSGRDGDDRDRDRQNGYGGGMNSGRQITIDDQPALDNQSSGHVYTGRYVTARGYWQNGVFYATEMN